MIKITQKYIPVGTKRRSGQKRPGTKFIVGHDTGNPNSTALQNVMYYINSCNESEQSAQAFIDDKQIIECMPIDEKAWHVRRSVSKDNEMFSADANDYAPGVELCYFPKDVPRSMTAYNNYVDYHAYLCKKYVLDPLKAITGHYVLDPSRRSDPLNAFKTIDKTWPQFIKDVVSRLKSSKIDNVPIVTTTFRRRRRS